MGQAVDHSVGAIGVERPEGKAPFPVIKDPQQGAGLEAILNGLPATCGEDLGHFGYTDAAGKELVAEGKAAPKSCELTLGGIGGGYPKPVGVRIDCPGAV